MRVLCIDASPNKIGEIPEIKEGEPYNATKAPCPCGSCYEIEGCFYWYGQFRFISCSDQENVVLEDVLVLKNQ